MPDLVERIRAVVEERKRLAETADTDRGWTYSDDTYGPKVTVGSDEDDYWSREVNAQVWECDDEMDGCPDAARAWRTEGRHIAANDPADTIRECRYALGVLERHDREPGILSAWFCRTCRPVRPGYCAEILALAERWSVGPDTTGGQT